MTGASISLNGITNESVKSLGEINADLYLNSHKLNHDFHLVNDDFPIHCDVLLGLDFMKKFSIILDYSTWTLKIQKPCVTEIPIRNGPRKTFSVIPSRSEVLRKIPFEIESDIVIEKSEIAPGVFVANTIASQKSPFVRILNTTENASEIDLSTLKFSNLLNYDVFTCHDVQHDRDEKVLELLGKNLPEMYKNTCLNLCKEYVDIFALKQEKLSTNNFYKQRIDLKNDVPVYKRNYRLPHAQKQIMNEKIEELLVNDVIEPSHSPWNSPLLLVPKKSEDGSKKWRLVVDYREVNKSIIPDKYPLPLISQVLDGLGRCKLFSTVDLQSAFHQVPLEESSRDVTSFSCEKGSFRYKVIPFGLNISPNAFSRMMAMAFSGLKADQAFLYMDDIIVTGCSETHHLKNLREVFDICRKFNLKLNPEKCKFFQNSVIFLGHRCTEHGIYPDSEKLKAVLQYPIPGNADEAHRFIQFANYYRRFIENFAFYAKPISKLTSKKTRFAWTDECQKNFEHLKQCLMNPPILQFPDFEKGFIITTDASGTACGAVLSQNINGNDLPIAYFSRSFSKGELNKSTIEKELLAIYFAINHFRPYVYLKHFVLRSDHLPLKFLYTLKNPTGRLARIRLELAEYDFDIEFIAGKMNTVADALSRINIDDLKKLQKESEDFYTICKVTTRSAAKTAKQKQPDNYIDQFNQLQPKPVVYNTLNNFEIAKCPKLYFKLTGEFHCLIVYRKRTRNVKLMIQSFVKKGVLDLRGVLSRLDDLSKQEGFPEIALFTDDEIFKLLDLSQFSQICNDSLKNVSILIAKPLQKVENVDEQFSLIEKFHNDPILGGHCGKQRLLAVLKSYYVWKNMQRQVAEFTKTCHTCQINKVKIKNKPNFVITDTPSSPFSTISMDLCGPFEQTANNNKYALTIQCELTKYVVIVPLQNKQADTVAQALIEHFYLIYPCPKKIKTDCGSEFVNAIFESMTEYLKINHCLSSPYHPLTIASLERNHRYLNTYIRSYVNTTKNNWDVFSKFYAFHWNISPMPLLKNFSPFELVFNMKPNIPCGIFTTVEPLYNPDDVGKLNKYRYQVSLQNARHWLEEFKALQTERLNENSKEIPLKVGDLILVTLQNRTKLDPFFQGPFKIIEINHPNVFIEKKDLKYKIHMDRVIKYHQRKLWDF